MKRRYVLKNKRRFASFIITLSFVFVFAGFIVNSGAASFENNIREVICVQKGDTLWEIASLKAGNSDIREYIFNIKKLNNLTGDDIYIGQTLILP